MARKLQEQARQEARILTTADRLPKSRQKREVKAAFAAKLTFELKRRK